MATIQQAYENWAKLDIEQEVVNTVLDHKEDILQLNKDQLLNDGHNAKGQKLTKYRSDQYARRKHRKNPFPGLGNPDLYNKGDFFHGFRLNIRSKKEFEPTSTDSKTKALISKYGKDIFGLKPDSIAELIDGGFRNSLQDRVRKAVKL